ERPFWTRWEMMKMITFHLAGAAAEEVFFKDTSTMSSGSKDSDFAKATSLAVKMVTEYGFGSSRYYLPGSVDASSPLDLWQDQRLEAEVNEILQQQYDRAFDMLGGLETSLVQFAVKLAEMKTLQGNDLKMLWPGADTSDGQEARKC
ncbi:ATP-dependent Zn protease, partial [Agrobacterium rhizogenes]|nr:ATP-dependent Zn protease [Rhizobium rhizogenes]